MSARLGALGRAGRAIAGNSAAEIGEAHAQRRKALLRKVIASGNGFAEPGDAALGRSDGLARGVSAAAVAAQHQRLGMALAVGERNQQPLALERLGMGGRVVLRPLAKRDKAADCSQHCSQRERKTEGKEGRDRCANR